MGGGGGSDRPSYITPNGEKPGRMETMLDHKKKPLIKKEKRKNKWVMIILTGLGVCA